VGRLFWKFFLFIWLAQLGGIVAVALIFWLTQPRLTRPLESIDAGPAARTNVSAAAAILRYGGEDALKSWVSHDSERPVYAVDPSGTDILGRSVAPAAIAEAREVHEADPSSPLVAETIDPAHHRWMLFAVGWGHPGPPPGEGFSGPPPHTPPPGGQPPHPGRRAWPPAGLMITTLLASLLTAALLAWYVAKPIRSLRIAFAAASRGRLDQRVAPLIGRRQDELADLGQEFDRMAERLQESMSRQKRLLHDVSHEVRSPLARLHAALGLLRQKASSDETTVRRIEEEIGRIDRLVGDLLKLSRLEAGDLAEALEEVDLHELVAQVVADANFEAQGREIVWATRASAMLLGRPGMLHVAFENILRNALKHAPNSKIVTVETTVDTERSRFTFHVLDSGPGVREDELSELFTPFFRSDRASAEGYGLGLAIARRSVEAHGGTVRARNRPGGGLSVEIELPLSSSVRSG
jgi:two-component system, OmpR family, sensor kinase